MELRLGLDNEQVMRAVLRGNIAFQSVECILLKGGHDKHRATVGTNHGIYAFLALKTAQRVV